MRFAPYGWIIDVDRDADLKRPAPSNSNAVGMLGPRSISPDLEAQLKAGAGSKFRMFDDDGELVYEGRWVGDDAHPDVQGEDEFGPLDDFGTPNYGCTYIEYFNDAKGVWEQL